MRSKIIIITAVLFAVTMQYSFSQSKSEKVKTRLIELFELVKQNKYEDAASYIVYNGEDKKRNWKDVYNYDNNQEAREVDMVCDMIWAIFNISTGYTFVKFKTETESEGQWCIWELKFEKSGATNYYFAFLKINGKYCLGDID